MEFISESVLDVVLYLFGELDQLQFEYPRHPARHHFCYGRPRIHKLIIQPKENPMSQSTASIINLNTPSTTFSVTALDQYGQPYTGDMSGLTVTSSDTANVTASISPFIGSEATLTLAQAGGEGHATITLTDGTITAAMDVNSYVPVLTTLSIGAAGTGTPAVAPTASTTAATPAA